MRFPGLADQILEKQYLTYCGTALEDFCTFYWPCKFHYMHRGSCVNVKEAHIKGHQNEKCVIIGTGP